MSSTVCQGLQSCLVEPPRALRLKLAPAVQNPSPATNDDDSAWLRNCFFQSPSDTSSSFDGNACPEYVHPLTKRRLSMLSEKSLEMCTESLGSETGTHVGDYDVSPAAAVRRKETKPRAKKLNRAQSFPPPLKSTGVQVRSVREGGRLVVAVTAAEEWKSVFHVERSEGRIRVEMVRDSEEMCLEEDEEVEEEETVGDGEVAEVDDGGVVVVSGEGEDMDGNIGIVEGDLGTEKFGRPRRCMESQRRSNQSLLKQNWEPCLVTI